MTVRRVVINLNTLTRDGDTEMVILSNLPLDEFCVEPMSIATSMKIKKYRKSVRSLKKPPPKKKGNKRTVHVSTKRILDIRNEK